jgi:DNA primase catalytic subunit
MYLCPQPRDHHTIKADLFKTIERELVFDIDLSDYDDVSLLRLISQHLRAI